MTVHLTPREITGIVDAVAHAPSFERAGVERLADALVDFRAAIEAVPDETIDPMHSAVLHARTGSGGVGAFLDPERFGPGLLSAPIRDAIGGYSVGRHMDRIAFINDDAQAGVRGNYRALLEPTRRWIDDTLPRAEFAVEVARLT